MLQHVSRNTGRAALVVTLIAASTLVLADDKPSTTQERKDSNPGKTSGVILRVEPVEHGDQARKRSWRVTVNTESLLASIGAFLSTARLELRLIVSMQGGSGSSAPRQSRANPCLRVIPQDLRDPHIRASDLCASSHTVARVPPFDFGGARAGISQRIVKERPHCPDILILRQIRPTLASLSGSCFLLDGSSAIATVSFCRDRPDAGVPLRPFPGASCECFFAAIHNDFDRPHSSALATTGAGGIRMTLKPTAFSLGERSPNPSESRSSVPWKKHQRCV